MINIAAFLSLIAMSSAVSVTQVPSDRVSATTSFARTTPQPSIASSPPSHGGTILAREGMPSHTNNTVRKR